MTDIFTALADGNRRHIVESLTEVDGSTATVLAGSLGISRQAVAKHLEILSDAGVVTATKQGRERVYRFIPDALEDVNGWVARVQGEWDRRLSRLADHLESR